MADQIRISQKTIASLERSMDRYAKFSGLSVLKSETRERYDLFLCDVPVLRMELKGAGERCTVDISGAILIGLGPANLPFVQGAFFRLLQEKPEGRPSRDRLFVAGSEVRISRSLVGCGRSREWGGEKLIMHLSQFRESLREGSDLMEKLMSEQMSIRMN